MKRRNVSGYLLLAALLLSSLTVGCSDDPTSSTENGSMTAKVGGDGWGATTLSAQQVAGTLIIVGSELDMEGGGNRQINLTVTNAAVGESQLGGVNSATGTLLSYAEGTSAQSLKTYASTEGTVNITSLSATGASGTFTATVEHNQGGQADGTTIEITEGSFDVTF